ncbi:DNA replication factor C complex subunit Rfc5 [Schizosaccharomyces japonicus yFS275]|uniref:Replication factor C subunit 5 n=1 Tax=Schizosaccharomyces japonicus (strain yFS275 / FY16936) TaxID=402676 RepID=B6JV68_SCHJY|nr:DNA replication factor C complex subunit Rfc5 [Schizosaccharomyces japonicus yFS275]EEB05269.1 DNA replication factor C complex subunit Rfc5 [Schizosaccharomyces japonicus yFS275]
MLWLDQYRPKTLANLDYHTEQAERLTHLAASNEFPHLLIYGPSGAGKKTRVVALLRELFGPGAEKLKIDQRVFLTPSNRKIQVNIVSSLYHLELTPSDVGNYDRVVMQELLKDVAQSAPVDIQAKKRFKAVVINEADSLTRDAQAALRRTMEKYSDNIRLILIANSTSKIIEPVRSRTLLIRVAAPTHTEIVSVLTKVLQQQSLEAAPSLLNKIAQDSDRNLRKALLILETLYAKAPGSRQIMGNTGSIPKPDWQEFIDKVADAMIAEQSPNRILSVRSMLYDLLSHCIPPSIVLKELASALLAKVKPDLHAPIISSAANYEHRIHMGNKSIFHLEAFVAFFMKLYAMSLMGMSIENM